MAEKRVSIRLAAVGGQQVRAELEGIGDAGSRGLGRVSAETDRASERLVAFASRVKIALVAAVTAAATAGVMMVRSSLQAIFLSSLQVIDAQAKLATSLSTTVESVQIVQRAAELAGVSFGELETATSALTRRLSEAAAGGGPAAEVLARLRLNAAELLALPLDQRLIAIQQALVRYIPEAERAAVASDLFGKIGLAITRIDTATLRTATRDIREFGVAVSKTDAAAVERANDAVSQLGIAWQGLANSLAIRAAPMIERVADFIASLLKPTSLLGTALSALIDQLGRLASYAATTVVFFGVRWVAALATATIASARFSGALGAIKWAVTGLLSRTGLFGLLIIISGELTYQFLRLADYVGGVSELFARLGPMSVEVFGRVKIAVESVVKSVTALWLDFAALIAEQMPALESIISTSTQRFVGAFTGAKDAIIVVWGGLKGWFAHLFNVISNNVLSSMEGIINGIIERLNIGIGRINEGLRAIGVEQFLAPIGNVNFATPQPIDSDSIRDIGEAASKAFWDAYLKPPEDLDARAEEMRRAIEAATGLRSVADKYRADAADLRAKIFEPLKSLEGLGRKSSDAFKSNMDKYRAELDRALSDELAGRLGKIGKGLDDLAQKSSKLPHADNRLIKGRIEALMREYEAIRDTSRRITEDITTPIKDALKSAELSWRSFSDTVLSIARNMVARLIDAAFRPLENALTNVFVSVFGGFVGGGGLPAAISAAAGFARGGVFQNGHELKTFAGGGVISKPVLFPLANGVGLAGEAGPEAILPLRRGAGGRLGVEARGMGSTIVNVSIDARGADVGAAARIRATIPQLARAVTALARDEAARGLARA